MTTFRKTPFPHWAGSYGVPAGTGKVLFVDSGATNASNGNLGDSPERPLATIEGAFNHSTLTANNGDMIVVMPGHSETITAAAGIDMDVAGVTVLGLGNGRDRPTINFTTATGADIDIDAANITLDNLYFDVTGVDAVTAAIDVNAADFTMQNCEVLGADACGQMTEFILTDANADRMRILNNVIRSPNAGANNAISIVGTPDGIEIAGNLIHGDFADACIHNPTSNVATNLFIHDNDLYNDQTGDHAIELVSACTGVIANNRLSNDTYGAALDPGSCRLYGNTWSDDAADTGDVPIPETASSVGAGAEPAVRHTGEVFYVDSGHGDASDTAGYGTSPFGPFATIDFAVGQCTASNGDTIYVMPGHAETVSAAGGLDLDVIGIRVVGLGEGNNRPTITLDTADTADIDVDAAEITLENVIIDGTGFDSITSVVDVNAAGFTLKNCRLILSDGCGQVDSCVTTGSARTRILYNEFVGSSDAGPEDAIEVTGTPDGIEIIGNTIVGDFSNAGIQSASAFTNAVIRDNVVRNLNSGNHAIQLSAAATGFLYNNLVASDAIGTSIDPGSMVTANNKWQDSNFTDSVAIPVPLGAGAAGVAPLEKFISRTDVTTSMASGFDTTDSPKTIFTVTGDVVVYGAWFVTGATGVSSDSDTGTWALGVTGNTAVFQAQTTLGSGTFAAHDVWSNGGATPGQDAETTGTPVYVSGDGTNIILTIGSQNTAGGVGDFYCLWAPVSAGSSVIGQTI